MLGRPSDPKRSDSDLFRTAQVLFSKACPIFSNRRQPFGSIKRRQAFSSANEMPSHQNQQRHTTYKHRRRLTESQVQSIYLAKKPGNRATKIAGSFGVNEKTVRDIWSGRTWAKETLHVRHGYCESSGSPSQIFERKQPMGTILTAGHQAPRPVEKHDRRNEIKFQNVGKCYDDLEHRSDPVFPSVDEQLWRWEETIWCDLCSSDPFKLDWKPEPCVD